MEELTSSKQCFETLRWEDFWFVFDAFLVTTMVLQLLGRTTGSQKTFFVTGPVDEATPLMSLFVLTWKDKRVLKLLAAKARANFDVLGHDILVWAWWQWPDAVDF